MTYISRRITFLKLICTFLAAATLLSAPGFAFAAAKPWDKYAKYLPAGSPAVKRQLRGVWISTVINLDWPSSETKKIANAAERIKKSKEELIAILDRAAELNMNAVFFQVSPEGDALYKSSIVPWSRYLTGTFGKDPGFDPLEFAAEEAHRRNLEIHAWFNPYRVSMYTDASAKASLNIEKSVYREHPGWIRTAGNRFVVDPGIPAAAEWVMDRVMEVVDCYDIDGVHFDDYFYNESYVGELKDQATYKKYNDGKFSSIGDWRRNNTYLLIKELSERIKASKPWVKFGVSPAGIWANKRDGHPDGTDTVTSYTNYDRSFADTKKWVDEELIDYIAPQVYFSFGNTRAPYGDIASWWANVCKGKNVQLYIGQALYKVNEDSDPLFTGGDAVQEMTRQLKFNAVKPGISGSIMFRMNNFNDEKKQQVVKSIKSRAWSAKALVPVMPWLGGKAPATPVRGKLDVKPAGIRLSWTDNDPNTAYYAVYRFKAGEKADISADFSASRLVATVRKISARVQGYTDAKARNADGIYYVVTALDRLHHESRGLVISKSQQACFRDAAAGFTEAGYTGNTAGGVIQKTPCGFSPGRCSLFPVSCPVLCPHTGTVQAGLFPCRG